MASQRYTVWPVRMAMLFELKAHIQLLCSLIFHPRILADQRVRFRVHPTLKLWTDVLDVLVRSEEAKTDLV